MTILLLRRTAKCRFGSVKTVQEIIFVFMLVVYRFHVATRIGNRIVDENEQRFLGRQTHCGANDVQELAKRNEVRY